MAIYILQLSYGTFTSTILLLGRSKGSFRGSLGPSRDRWSILRGPCAQFTSPTILQCELWQFFLFPNAKNVETDTSFLSTSSQAKTIDLTCLSSKASTWRVCLEMFRIQLLMCPLNVEYNWSASWSSTLFPNLTEHIGHVWTFCIQEQETAYQEVALLRSWELKT